MRTAAEILKAAIEHEVKAGVFYNKAAELTNNDESRMVFLELIGMEDDHAKELVNMVKTSAFAVEFDAQAYLDELEENAENSVTVEETDLIKNGDMKAVLTMAIEMEEKATKNYEDLAASYTDPHVIGYCKKLAEEEEEARCHTRQAARLPGPRPRGPPRPLIRNQLQNQKPPASPPGAFLSGTVTRLILPPPLRV